MKTKSKKKLFSLVLAAAMVASMLPVAVFAGVSCQGGDACNHIAAIGDVHYDSLNDAVKAAKSGEEVLLLKDSKEVLDIVKSDVDFTINLNGKSIDTSGVDAYDTVNLEGDNLNLTIKNGSIINSSKDAYGVYMYSNKAESRGYKNLNLVLDSVIINTGDQAIGVQGLNYNQNVTVKNCTIDTKTTGIYFPPKSGKLVIENSKITAVDNGVVVKGGELLVKGKDTYIKATAEPEVKPPYTGDVTGVGFPKTGNPIYVEGGYKDDANGARPIAVLIEDGRFESENGSAVAANNFEDLELQTVGILGGIFSSNVDLFVGEESTIALLTSGEDRRYYVGTPKDVADRLAADAKTGDEIFVQQGDLKLDNLADKVSVSKDAAAGKVTVNGKEVGDKPVLSHVHKWAAPYWDWAKDYSKAVAVFICSNDDSHVKNLEAKPEMRILVKPTTDKDGKAEYKATVSLDGKTYTDTKVVVLPAGTEVPNTGDSNPVLPFAALIISAISVVAVLAMKKRHN